MNAKSILRRVAAGGVVLAATLAGALGTVPAASAAPAPGTVGTATVSPANGLDITAPVYTTSAGCPTTADGYNMFVKGPGAWAGGFIGTTTTSVNFSTTSGFPVQQGLSFKDIALDNQTTVVPGEYDVTINCVDSFSLEVQGTFTTAVYFTDATHYTSVDPNQPVTTTTSLSVTPASPAFQGDQVTLTANVTPASAGGTVQFKDGAANLGSPVAVNNGVATLNTSALTVGSHSLTAVFTGASQNIQGSTSQAVTYAVQTRPATATTTALAVTPSGSATQFQPVALSATVTPGAAAGAIQFTDNGANLGSPVALSGGTATLNTATLAVGAHSFTAKFVPADPAVFLASESAQVPLTVNTFAGVATSENITTTVTAGELLISVANQNVTLPSPTMLPDASMLQTAGDLNPVTVADTRAGNPGWNVSGQVTDFGDGQSHSINGANLGWTPAVVDKLAAQNITAGPAVNPAAALAPGAAAPAGVGLTGSRTMATAAPGGGNGTAHLGAGLALNVPTSTVAGTYTAVLTLTAI
ncbi:putative surface cell wall-binding protein [Amycolatopsis sulphurea]|uniref:Putative surface cell wall-binding protein n=1 Tax=Amycolatopsis sulphurea TaxID=76022 RepID=A0A2A9F6N8_9PSEU|nr:Ig-like domain-containing protein [Amycolatopsis sulphurea]PFG47014.1 putative surface cell wall-binding protein [Amycolatopsis sulphurea]